VLIDFSAGYCRVVALPAIVVIIIVIIIIFFFFFRFF